MVVRNFKKFSLFGQDDEALAEAPTSDESLNAVSLTQREIAAATVRVIERRILYRTEAVSDGRAFLITIFFPSLDLRLYSFPVQKDFYWGFSAVDALFHRPILPRALCYSSDAVCLSFILAVSLGSKVGRQQRGSLIAL